MQIELLMPAPKKELWYREPWLILVIGGPLLVVCASLYTGYLAMRGADQVVAKDYYRQGLMINTNLQRDAKAHELDLRANLQLDLSAQRVHLSLSSRQNLPDSLQLSLASSGAQAGGVEEIVRRLSMRQVSQGRYEGDLQQTSNAKFPVDQLAARLLHVKLETTEWRLTGDWHEATENRLQLVPNR